MIIIYLKIRHQLNKTEAKLNRKEGLEKFSNVDESNREETFDPGRTVTIATVGVQQCCLKEKPLKQKRHELQKTRRLNKQLIAVMICYFLSFLVSFVMNFRYIIPDFDKKFYYFRQVLRILNVFFQSLIPVVSLYFNPHLSGILKKIQRNKRYVV